MAFIRNCKTCNALISIRKMPNGNWIPFDFQTDELHDCKKKPGPNAGKKRIDYKPGTKLYRIAEAIKEEKYIEFYYDSKTAGSRKYSIMKPTEIIEPVRSTDKHRVFGTAILEDCVYDFRIDKIKFVNICNESQVADALTKHGSITKTTGNETVGTSLSHVQSVHILDLIEQPNSKGKKIATRENNYRPGTKLDTIASAIRMNQFIEFYYDSEDRGKNYYSIMKPTKIINPKERYQEHRIIGSGILEKCKYDFEVKLMKYVKACDAEFVNNILAKGHKEKEELEKVFGIDVEINRQTGSIEEDYDIDIAPKSNSQNKMSQLTMHDKANKQRVSYLPIIIIVIILLWMLYLTLI